VVSAVRDVVGEGDELPLTGAGLGSLGQLDGHPRAGTRTVTSQRRRHARYLALPRRCLRPARTGVWLALPCSIPHRKRFSGLVCCLLLPR
jgi:hypothetical protein